MEKFRGKYRIESNRATFWDYSSPADYFITICISGGKHILGKVDNDRMQLSEYGEIIKSEFKKIPDYHKRVIMGTSVVMPNHIHFIVSLGDYDFENGISMIGDKNDDVAVDGDDNGNGNVDKIHEFYLLGSPAKQWWQNTNYKPTIDEIKQYRKQRRKMLIPKILGKFQQQTSKQINILRNTPGAKNWQADYNDHIIRDDESFQRIKNYIINNPEKCQMTDFIIIS